MEDVPVIEVASIKSRHIKEQAALVPKTVGTRLVVFVLDICQCLCSSCTNSNKLSPDSRVDPICTSSHVIDLMKDDFPTPAGPVMKRLALVLY